MHIRLFNAEDTESVIQLWKRCELLRPWNDPRRDIERKLSVNDDLFLVGTKTTGIVAAAMAGYDGHRGWVNYLAVDPDCRRQGLGRQLMADVEARLLERGCPKLNLQVRTGNAAVLAFYQRLGYAEDATVSLGKRLIPDQ